MHLEWLRLSPSSNCFGVFFCRGNQSRKHLKRRQSLKRAHPLTAMSNPLTWIRRRESLSGSSVEQSMLTSGNSMKRMVKCCQGKRVSNYSCMVTKNVVGNHVFTLNFSFFRNFFNCRHVEQTEGLDFRHWWSSKQALSYPSFKFHNYVILFCLFSCVYEEYVFTVKFFHPGQFS